MKTKIILFAGVLAMLTLLSACRGRKIDITSFDTVLLSETGMRASSEEWEFVRTETGLTYTHYSGSWKYNDNIDREDCIRAKITGDETFYREMLQTFIDAGMGKWNDFAGKNPIGVRDGTMFTLEAYVNEGEKIYAHGSNNYPKGYNKLKEALKALDKRAEE